MSFVKNMFFGGVSTSEDPTGLSNNNNDNSSPNGNDSNQGGGMNSNEEPIVAGKFFPRTLYKFNGHDDEKIFISILGKVYDCTQGRQFYGPSGPYANFAGHDASRGLAMNSFEMGCVRDWDQPMDDLSDLTQDQRDQLNDWYEFFQNKYPCIGVLVPEPGVNI
ncbi:Dap1p NDAI_0K01200 [Naumovozyma dairenensis CBS 421]|uniref:Cytochrome b5 heme-binding domain-containing protein n=1 Tax=Naumovozyma dairenensis (strain ATCC 10597 / BCRC 20456 / CBS 421 / NBRC 0211 / NRRL Y-12639) TaxID=1071378 RepID=G0WHQ0_NAUDC|nr:hypothetical protein NDAI_0K01200 [Naumovozyma dairenensis CBS 421]CCD27311.1 hypothetical protein NDAI_0K01200 [Naumovozyma dairenensis CBS 421]